MCGEHARRTSLYSACPGSSPHVRGAHTAHYFSMGNAGIIPACAGSTSHPSSDQSCVRDHPRMCGEHSSVTCTDCATAGSSPHVRGAHRACHYRDRRQRIIPACAGSTNYDVNMVAKSRDHPRMCGEHITSNPYRTFSMGSSPHVRGALGGVVHLLKQFGIIPACAGSTRTPRRRKRVYRDHPRMCGEHTLSTLPTD